MKPKQLEIERLWGAIEKLKAERDILEKAAAYYEKGPMSRSGNVWDNAVMESFFSP